MHFPQFLYPKPAFEIIKDPDTYSPWGDYKIYETWGSTSEIGTCGMHCFGEFFEGGEEVGAEGEVFGVVWVEWFVMEELVEGGDYAGGDEVDPWGGLLVTYL